MSKDDCITYLKSHPGPRSSWQVSVGINCEVSSTNRYLLRLYKDGMVKRYMSDRENAFYLYEAL